MRRVLLGLGFGLSVAPPALAGVQSASGDFTVLEASAMATLWHGEQSGHYLNGWVPATDSVAGAFDEDQCVTPPAGQLGPEAPTKVSCHVVYAGGEFPYVPPPPDSTFDFPTRGSDGIIVFSHAILAVIDEDADLATWDAACRADGTTLKDDVFPVEGAQWASSDPHLSIETDYDYYDVIDSRTLEVNLTQKATQAVSGPDPRSRDVLRVITEAPEECLGGGDEQLPGFPCDGAPGEFLDINPVNPSSPPAECTAEIVEP